MVEVSSVHVDSKTITNISHLISDLSEVPALDEVSCKISGCFPMMHRTQVSPGDAWHLSSVNIV